MDFCLNFLILPRLSKSVVTGHKIPKVPGYFNPKQRRLWQEVKTRPVCRWFFQQGNDLRHTRIKTEKHMEHKIYGIFLWVGLTHPVE